MSHARETTLTFFFMYLSLLMSEVYLLVNLFSKLCVTFIRQWIAFIVGMSRARETTLTFFVMYLSPLKSKSCAGHNSHTV